MLHNPFHEEIFPNTQLKPPLVLAIVRCESCVQRAVLSQDMWLGEESLKAALR